MTDIASDSFDIAANLTDVKSRIADAAKEAGRDPAEISLVAVSKVHPAERIEPALQAGHRLFGENRVQELKAKWPELKQRYPDAAVHLIGPLQTNKVKEAVQYADAIQSVDRPKLAEALAREAEKTGALPQLLVQINTGEEPQKAGVLPGEADAFLARCRTEWQLPVVGVMAIPPVDEEASPHFALLVKIAERNGLSVRSFGMSGDYEAAIRHGATHVRVGTAIFGARPPKPGPAG